MLEVRNVHKSFEDREVLKGVDLRVNKGDVVTILGRSGSGKTTFLRCINFLEQADQGTMTLDQETFELAHVSRQDKIRIRRKTAFVFQNYNLFRNKTALENVKPLFRRWKRSGCGIGRWPIRISFPAVSSSASGLPERSPPNLS